MSVMRKRYMETESLIIHLKLKAEHEKWNPCICPLKPAEIKQGEIWNYILQINNHQLRNGVYAGEKYQKAQKYK